ncbi:MAG: HDOD domain-containing protein [Pyrinomonadaceae bacterium]
MPRTALRVMELTKDLTTPSRVVADTISADPVLAANIIRAANSPLYTRDRPITTLPAAVSTLGHRAIHMLVVVLVAFDFFNRKSKSTASLRALWEHSLTTAAASREICEAFGLRLGDQAFLTGLLHDIGRLLLLCHDPDRYTQLSLSVCEQELSAREREIYGYDHAEIGEHVAQYWRLPREIVQAIKYHHKPEQAGEYSLVAHVVDAAGTLSNAAGATAAAHGGEGGCCDLSSVKLVAELGITDEQLMEIWERSVAKMQELAHFFG